MFLRKLIYPFGIVLLCLTIQMAAAHHNISKSSSMPRLLRATVQRTLPGPQGAEPVMMQRILVIWESGDIPQTFFWRPDGNTWMTCAVTRAHWNGRKNLVYDSELINLPDIHRGDTLELTPMHGRDIMPADAKTKPTSAVYFTAEKKKGWQTIAVKHFEKLPDIIMP